MSKLRILLKYNQISQSKYFVEKNFVRKIVIALFGLSFLLLMLSEITVFYYLFNGIKSQTSSNEVLLTILSLSLLVISFISFIASLTQFGKSIQIQSNDEYLLSLPIGEKDHLSYKVIQSFIMNIMINILLSLPIIFVYLFVYNAPLYIYILSISLVILSSVIISSIACLLTLIVYALFPKVKTFIKLNVVYVLLLMGFYILLSLYIPNFNNLMSSKSMDQFINVLGYNKVSILFPSTIISNIVIAKELFINISLLVLEVLISVIALSIILEEIDINLLADKGKSYIKIPYINKYLIFIKDINLYLQEEFNISSSGSIIFLLMFFVFILINIRNIIITSHSTHLFNTAMLTAIGYIISLIGLYFVYPSFSQEGRAGWIIFSSPLKRLSIYYQKIAASLLFILIHTIVLCVVYLILMHNMNIGIGFLAAYSIIVSISLSIIFTSLGTAFPNFAKRDIEDLSTTPGGLLSTLVAIFYIFSISMIYYNASSLITVISMIGISLTVSGICLFVGKNRISLLDFAVRN